MLGLFQAPCASPGTARSRSPLMVVRIHGPGRAGFLTLSTVDPLGHMIVVCMLWRAFLCIIRSLVASPAPTPQMPVVPSLPSVINNKNKDVSRHCQMSLWGQNPPQLRTSGIDCGEI